MEEERTNLVPRLQQDAYLHGLAAARPGHVCPCPLSFEQHISVHAVSDSPLFAHDNCTLEIASNHQSPVAAASNSYGVQVASVTGFSGGYQHASSRFSAFPYSVGNFSVINGSSSNNYAPFHESHSFAQGLPAAGIANRYLADSFDYPHISRFGTSAPSSAQSYAFSTGALELTNPTHAGYSGILPVTQYCPGPSNCIERPFATDAAFNGTDTFATGTTIYTNGHVIADSPLLMPVSDNHIVPQDIGFMNEDPIPLPPNIYNTGQASACYPFPMHVFNNPNAPMDMGLMTESPTTLSQNNYTTSQASAINPYPMPTSNSALIPVDGPPSQQRPSCSHCNETFSRQSDLERHAKKHSSGPKEFKCRAQGCKYESHRKDKLVEHMRRRHAAAGNHAN